MVNVYVPARVEVAVVTVKVEDPEPLTEAGLKPAVAPAGTPLTLSPTLPLNPFTAPTFAV